MDALEIQRIIGESRQGSSGRGISYWSDAALCGRRVRLKEEHPKIELPIDDDDTPDALVVGATYHLLHELSIRGQLADETWDATDGALTASTVQALNLHRAWMRDWTSLEAKWGARALAVELAIPETDVGKQAALTLTGDVVTGRLDALIDVHDPDTAYANTGLLLPGPGRYILDFKTAKNHSSQHAWVYSHGLQGINYLWLYNMEHPETPARGLIFDVIFKHAKPTKEARYASTGRLLQNSSYAAYLQDAHAEPEKVIRGLVQLGQRNLEGEGVANAEACFKGHHPCEFFRRGLCRRY